MQESNKFLKIVLKGKNNYECLLSPELIIIKVEPFNEYLLNKDLNTIWADYRGLFSLNIKDTTNPLPLINEDIYALFKEKNNSIEYLKNKFDCVL